MKRKKNTTLNDSPLALGSDGTLLLNISHVFEMPDDLGGFVEQLVRRGDDVFIGVAIPDRVRRELLDGLDDHLAEAVARLGIELRRKGSPRS